MLTRLTDKTETGADGSELKIIRYGKWGTSAEIEVREEKYFVVYPNTNGREKYRTRRDAEARLDELIRDGL